MDAKMTTIDIGVAILGISGAAGGVFSFFRYGNYKATVKLQNDSIAALEKNNEILTQAVEESKKAHIEYVKEIGILEGQVRIYKDLQLEKMAQAMQDISKTNQEILAALKGETSSEAKASGGLLVNTSGQTPSMPITEEGVQ